ncbi:MAG: FAD binding domain-containing protein [Nitrospinota bacterium]
MIPARFDYRRARSVKEAVRLLAEHGEEAKILAGGHSLLPILKARLAQPGLLIDIGRVRGLDGIRAARRTLIIGALVTHYQVESSELLKERCPLLPEVAAQIGDVQVRNRGTVGGSLAHADPGADYPAVVIALRASVEAQGSRGKRAIAADEFFTDVLTTALAPDEVLTTVRVPAAGNRSGSAYCKVAQQASGFAICGVAAQVALGRGNRVKAVGLGVTGVAGRAYRPKESEAALLGEKPTPAALDAAAARAAEGVEPLEDLYASKEFRAHLARVWTRRALEKALERARA